MDPVSLIMTALTTGAAQGATETTSQAVKDACAALRKKLKERLAGRPTAEAVLAEYEADPGTWKDALTSELIAAGPDTELVSAAEAILQLVDKAGWQTGKYDIDISDSQGVQIGDNGEQHNFFAGPGSASMPNMVS